jgi:hypothetical protein
MKKQKSRQNTTVPIVKTLDPETAEFLVRLKEPPVPNSPTIKLQIQILEEGGSLEDLHLWNAYHYLVSTGRFVLQNIKDLAAIRDKSIASNFQKPLLLPCFQVPEVLLRDLNAYLKNLDDLSDEYGNRLRAKSILDLLPYWPYALQVFDMMLERAKSNAKGWNKRRWANTLRDLRADDCPLGEDTKKVAIYQYRMALAMADEFKDLPQVINGGGRQLSENQRQVWAKIVKTLVDYLSPFFPVTRMGKPYNRMVKVTLHHEKEAISRTTFKIAANILHLAYPAFWPHAGASSRVKNLYHGS